MLHELKSQSRNLIGPRIRQPVDGLVGRTRLSDGSVARDHRPGIAEVEAPQAFAHAFDVFGGARQGPEPGHQGRGFGLDQPSGLAIDDALGEAADTGRDDRNPQLLHLGQRVAERLRHDRQQRGHVRSDRPEHFAQIVTPVLDDDVDVTAAEKCLAVVAGAQ